MFKASCNVDGCRVEKENSWHEKEKKGVRLLGESVKELTEQFRNCSDFRGALMGFESSLNALRIVLEYLTKLQHALPAPAGNGGAGNPGRGPCTLGPFSV